MTQEEKKERLLNELRSLVTQYMDDNVTKPSLETIEKDFFAQDHLVCLKLLVDNMVGLVHKEGLSFDKELLMALSKEEVEKRIESLERFIVVSEKEEKIDDFNEREALNYLESDSSKMYLLPYLTKEINWIVISILSASYVSSLILMRAVFELLVGMATRHTGSMKDRIDEITFLEDVEKKNLKKLWDRLCAWGHPYGKWLKEVCPIYAAHHPLYHPKLCELCLKELTEIVDLFLVIVISKYEVNTSKVQVIEKKFNIDLSNYKMLSSRICA